MKKVAVVALFVGLVGANALGGIIEFDPTGTTIDRNVDDPVFTVDLLVGSSSLGSFNAVDIVVGSDDGLDLTGFTVDPSVIILVGPTITNPGPGSYADDIKFGWLSLPLQAGAMLGTLTVDTTGLADGVYDLMIDSGIDGGRSKLTSGLNVDSELTGSHRVVITPEPATISLLGLAALALVRRRKIA